MRNENFVEQFAQAIYSFPHDFPLIADPDYDYQKMRADKAPLSDREKYRIGDRKRKPRNSDIRDIKCFTETWGSTALGFGGVGGAAMTTALTVVITTDQYIGVYWGGLLGYLIDRSKNKVNYLKMNASSYSRREAKELFGNAYLEDNAAGEH